MKQINSLFRIILMAILLMGSAQSNAVNVDGINYSLYRSGDGDSAVPDSAIVIGPRNYSGDLNIPSHITVPYTYTKLVGYDEDDKPIYITVTRNLTYPVTAIKENAFSCFYDDATNTINSVTIPNTITHIGGGAFYLCTNITGTIIIPSSVNDIGDRAFSYCSGISRAILDNSIIGEDQFCYCTGLTDVIMSNLITSIKRSAFYGCTGLTNITIPNTVTSIENSAFFECTGLAGQLYIPNSVTTIGQGAFRRCSGLSGVSLGNCVTSIGDNAFEACVGLTGQLILPNSVTIIGSGAFANCSGLTGPLIIPNSVTKIDSYAFENCTGLMDLTLPNSLSSIGKGAFYNCSKIESVNIPKNVTIIGDGAFNATRIKKLTYDAKLCKSSGYMTTNYIEEVSIGDQVEYLPTGFASESKIIEVTIPKSVKTIYEGAFYNCDSLKTLYWKAEDCVIKGDYDDGDWYMNPPFIWCPNLAEIIIDKDVKSIGDQMFYVTNYKNHFIDSVISYAVVPPTITEKCFYMSLISTYDRAILCVPKGSLQAYQEAEGWKEFLHIVEMEEEALRGDVDGDGIVGIADVVALIDVILAGGNNSVCDIDGDQIVGIADVVFLIDYLLTGTWSDESVNPDEQNVESFTVNGVTFNMITIDGGTFTMGEAPEQDEDAFFDNEKPVHEVTLSTFSIGETEVTQELWQAVMGSNPSFFTGNLQRPVEQVSWEDCQTFIAKLNQMTGRTFRLPTEAEWEYAARGGNKSGHYVYAGSNEVYNVAWYGEDETHAVATKLPNELGVYDMSGNVWEWCHDWYGDYSGDAQTNPTGPASGTDRVCRGGGCGYFTWCYRVLFRNYNEPTYSENALGLRLAM